ncbi:MULTISPECIES: hypothetical protein [unclassified Mesorhizobium]|uniref:hypothetical protein n=1 Tax=unclassified Mesorhizobium TaxID=325217 RepID=UPI00112679F9|nr:MULTISPECIES: hypothetical protein [unclassified Mesorhizobium]TPN43676.1 hypothetical protein FJ976_27775 [Mesorhizobium sp. B1-1-9]TPN44634.1 hypothetical protein FJ978_28845 [Mesorhizobium sp. B1-1-7]
MHDFGLVEIMLSAAAIIAVAACVVWLLRQARSRRRTARRADPANDYAVRGDWGRSTGTVNYSSFVYFDVDRDGKYGVGDRPMAGIMVRLFDEQGGFVASARTNNVGFANFAMSTSSANAAIRLPGTYGFSVSVPPGWRSPSANVTQSQRFWLEPGSPTGLVSQDLPRPVGLAPPRSLAGRMAADGAATLSVMASGQELERRALAPDTAFRLELADEADAVVIAGGGLDRQLALSPYPTDLGLMSPQTLPGKSALRTIGFDDVTGRGFRKIPCGHAGLQWRNLNAMAQDHTKGSEGYVNGNVSGDHVAYTSSGYPAEFWSETPFGFHSVLLSAAWLKSEGEMALIECWLGEQLVASDELALSALSPLHYAPMLRKITRVRLSTKHHWQMVLDDLVLTR